MSSEELQFNIFLLTFTLGMLTAFGYGMKYNMKASAMMSIYAVVGLASALIARLVVISVTP